MDKNNSGKQRPAANRQADAADRQRPPAAADASLEQTAEQGPGGVDGSDGGKQFGRYRLVRELGRGGMGVVYHAYDPQLQRHLALKILSQPMQGDKERKRFERETCLMARLDHPHIIKIFDVGQAESSSFFTMELVDGTDLSHLIKESLPLLQSIKLLAAVANAVHYAHEQGVVHRDLKPSNIMVTRQGEPKVMDFGLAKEVSKNSSQLSKSHELLGTPEYMAPEQAAGKVRAIDAQSDVYALGVILYEILAGKTPFGGANPMAVLYKIGFEEPKPPSQSSPGISRELEAICLKAMEKEKSKRYASARELAKDLERYLQGEPVLAKPVTTATRAWKWARRHRLAAIGSMLMACAVIGIVLWFMWQKELLQQQTQRKNSELEAESARLKIESVKLKKESADNQIEKAKLNQQRTTISLKHIKALIDKARVELVTSKSHIEQNRYAEAERQRSTAQDTLESCRQNDDFALNLGENEKKQWHELRQACQLMQLAIMPHLYICDEVVLPTTADGRDVSYKVLATQRVSWKFAAGTRRNKHYDLSVFDLEQQTCLRTFELKAGVVATFSSNDQWFAFGENEGVITLWQIGTDNVRQLLIPPDQGMSNVWLVHFSDDGKWFVAATKSKAILWQLPEMKQSLVIPRDAKASCAFSRDGRWLALGSKGSKAGMESEVMLYDLQKLGNFYYIHNGYANCLCFGLQDKSLLIGKTDDVHVYQLQDLSVYKKDNLQKSKGDALVRQDHSQQIIANAHQGEISNLELSTDGKFLLSLGQDNRLVAWNSYTYNPMFTLQLPTNLQGESSNSLGFRAGYAGFMVCCSDRAYRWHQKYHPLYKINLATHPDLQNTVESRLRHLESYICARQALQSISLVAIAPDSKQLAFYQGTSAYLWDIPSNKVKLLATGIVSDAADNMQFSQDGRRLFMSRQGRMWMWDLPVREPYSYKSDKPEFFVYHPQDIVISRSADTTPGKEDYDVIGLWRIAGNERRLILQFNVEKFITATTFSNDGNLMALGRVSVDIYDTRDLTAVRQITRCPLTGGSALQTLCFLEPGYLAAGDNNGQLFIIDIERKTSLLVPLYTPIKRMWYDKRRRSIWLQTKKDICLYPYRRDMDSSRDSEFRNLYPLPVYAGHHVIAADFNPDFSQLAVMLQGGDLFVVAMTESQPK